MKATIRTYVRAYVLRDEFEYLFWNDLLRDLGFRLKDGKTCLVGRRFNFYYHALLETARQPLFASFQVFRSHIAGNHNLLVILHERVESVEELFLYLLFAGDELDVVQKEQVHFAVTFPE